MMETCEIILMFPEISMQIFPSFVSVNFLLLICFFHRVEQLTPAVFFPSKLLKQVFLEVESVSAASYVNRKEAYPVYLGASLIYVVLLLF